MLIHPQDNQRQRMDRKCWIALTLHSKWNKATPTPPRFNTVSCLTANVYSVSLRCYYKQHWKRGGGNGHSVGGQVRCKKYAFLSSDIQIEFVRACMWLFLPRLTPFNVHHSLFTQWRPTKSIKFHPHPLWRKKEGRESGIA